MRGRKKVMEMVIELLLLLNYIFCKLDTWLRVQLTTLPKTQGCVFPIYKKQVRGYSVNYCVCNLSLVSTQDWLA